MNPVYWISGLFGCIFFTGTVLADAPNEYVNYSDICYWYWGL